MRILLVHNYYQIPGGEDELFASVRDLLRARGHQVLEYVRRNEEISDYNFWQTALLPLHTLWAGDTSRELRQLLAEEKPDLVHFYNTFPLISPAAYYVCGEFSIRVIQSLDNPRLICPAASLYRDGHVCQDCLGRTPPWPSVRHGCYRGSRVETSVVAAMITLHRLLKTWHTRVALYLVATDFYRNKFIEAGFPAHKLCVKPHFVSSDPGCRTEPGDYALYMGRLSLEKGVRTLLRAWSRLKHIPLRIRGDGPLLAEVRAFADRNPNVQWLPRVSPRDRFDLIKGSRCLVWPSEGFYETFGLVVAESFACGVPVIASRLGVMEEIVTDGRTGLHFMGGGPEDLAAKVDWAWTHPREMEEMGRAARCEYEARYTAQRNYKMLMDIYALVTSRS